MFFMGVNVFKQLYPTVKVVIKFTVEHDFSRTLSSGDACEQGEHVAPKDRAVYHLNNHNRRNVLKRHRVV